MSRARKTGRKSPRKTGRKSPRKTGRSRKISCRVPSKSALRKMSTTKVQNLARSLENKASSLRKQGHIAAAEACSAKRSRMLQDAF